MARTAIHPGEHLAEELKELGISVVDAARHLNVPADHMTKVLDAECPITHDLALRLSEWLHTSPEFWLNLQSLYDTRLTRRAPSAGR